MFKNSFISELNIFILIYQIVVFAILSHNCNGCGTSGRCGVPTQQGIKKEYKKVPLIRTLVMESAIKKGSLREVCDWLLWNNVINLCRDFPPNYLYAEPTAAQRSEILGCCWCITRKYFGASSKKI